VSRDRLLEFGGRVHYVHAVYDQLPDVLEGLGYAQVQGVLFDLGVSSLQLDDDRRGFAYSRPAPLDMRMDMTTGQTAADVVNGYPVPELARVLREYGEERFALRIARAIAAARRTRRLDSTAELAELVRDAIPAATRRTGGHPAKRTFQALRIEVNAELDAVRVAIPAAVEAVAVGGRVVVLTYQSLEDRIVKQCFAGGTVDTTPVGLPVALGDHSPTLRSLTRGGEEADAAEIAANPRAQSARMRAVQRLRSSR
jgi:16S rRNA (cytosine1402-N4)-methyltransferase